MTSYLTKSKKRRCWFWTIWGRKAPPPGRGKSCTSCSTTVTTPACPPSSPQLRQLTNWTRAWQPGCWTAAAAPFLCWKCPAIAAGLSQRRSGDERRGKCAMRGTHRASGVRRLWLGNDENRARRNVVGGGDVVGPDQIFGTQVILAGNGKECFAGLHLVGYGRRRG